MSLSLRLFFLILSALLIGAVSNQSEKVIQHSRSISSSKITPSQDVQIAVRIANKPSPMLANNQTFLVYEIFVTNVSHSPLRITNLAVSKPKQKTSLAEIKQNDLSNNIYSLGSREKAQDPTLFPPGLEKVILMWLPFSTPAATPEKLEHHFTVTDIETQETHTLTPRSIKVKNMPSIVVHSPITGDRWVAVNGPSNTSIHRITYRAGDGRIYFAQRFAIDFVKIGEDGLMFTGDKLKNSSYHAYGADIHSVLPGKVVKVKEGIPENIPGDSRAVTINAETAGGNYVIIDIGFGLYAFYAHMQPGSIQVKEGDSVDQGQVLGKIGNTGNSSAPHLHFHIIDKPAFIYGNGMPYVFAEFYQYSSKAVPGDEIKIQQLDFRPVHVTNQLMLENTLVKFS